VDEGAHRRLVSRFLAAAAGGDLEELTSLLGEDVVLVSDGGGVVSAATRPIQGRDAVLRFLVGLATKFAGRFSIVPVELNGDAGWLLILDGELDYALSCVVEEDRITRFYLQRNPVKLGHIRSARSS
jgi:RNA polymerase sigma-70 factor (ECF subfamily)